MSTYIAQRAWAGRGAAFAALVASALALHLSAGTAATLAGCTLAAAEGGPLLVTLARRVRRTRVTRTVLAGARRDVEGAAARLTATTSWVQPVATATCDGPAETGLAWADLDDLGTIVRDSAAQQLVVCTPALYGQLEPLCRAELSHVRVALLPEGLRGHGPGVELVDTGGQLLVSLPAVRRPSGPAWMAKRVLDRMGAAAALLLLAPLFAVLAVLVKLDSPGPVFFKQVRVGRGGRPFRIWKFRSMVAGAESRLGALAPLNEANGPFFKMHNDPRVTRVGRWLRASYLDELPQLVNVVLGQMSLVGPRPALASEIAACPELFEWKLGFVPGMTGPCQLAGQPWLTVEEAVRLDQAYIRSWGPVRDLGLVLRTLARALSRGIRHRAGPGPDVVDVVDLPAPASADLASAGVIDLRSPVPAAASAGIVDGPGTGPPVGVDAPVGLA